MKSKLTQGSDRSTHHLMWILGLLALTSLFFFSRGFMVLIYVVVFPALLITLLVWAWKQLIKPNKIPRNSQLAKIQKRFRTCDKHIAKQEKELKEIEENMADLQKQLHAQFDISEGARKETESLINAFKEEKKLRTQKIAFFLSVKEKLLSILYNQEILESLKEKRQRLSELRAEHLDDLADMETLKQDIAFDQGYMDALHSLELKMVCTNQLDKVKAIKDEFDRMIDELS